MILDSYLINGIKIKVGDQISIDFMIDIPAVKNEEIASIIQCSINCPNRPSCFHQKFLFLKDSLRMPCLLDIKNITVHGTAIINKIMEI